MLQRIRNLLSQRLSFWKWRRRLARIIFFFRRQVFRLKGWLKGRLDWSRTLSSFFASSLIPIISAVVTTIGLIYIDRFLADKPLFAKINNPASSDYITFLVGVSSIGGVFIGLYYAALTTVGAEIYTRLPRDIQSLLIQDHVSNTYMRLLLYITYLPIFLIVSKTLGVECNRFAIVYVASLACIGIVNFAILGRRAFYFFDPTRLAETLFKELDEWIKEATYDGFKWSDVSFQNHTHQQTAYRIKALLTLGEAASNESYLKGEAYTSLVEILLQFLGNVKVRKLRIPTDSYWFPRVTKYKDWYLYPDQKLEIHARTGTQIEPEQAISHNWIEEELEPLALHCLSANIKAGTYHFSDRILAAFRFYVSRMAMISHIDDALDFCKRAREVTLKECAGCPPAKQLIEQIRLVLYCPTDVLLNYSAQQEHAETYLGKINNIDWKKPHAIYKIGAPGHHLEKLEYMQRVLEFERIVNRNIITPNWYITGELLKYEFEHVTKSIEKLISYHDGLSSNKNFENELEAIVTAECLSQRWERMQKLIFHINAICQYWSQILQHYKEQDLAKRLMKHMNKWQTSINSNREQIVKDITDWLLHRYSAKWKTIVREDKITEKFYDHEGQFLHIVIQAIVEMLSGSQSTQYDLRKLFTILFSGCLRKNRQLLQQLQNLDQEQMIRIAGSGIIDLMELSGLALVTAQVQRKPLLRRSVTQVWRHYLRRLKKSNNIDVDFFINLDKLTRSYFLGLAHRSVIRTGWGIAVRESNRTLYEQNHPPYDFFGSKDRLHGFFHSIETGVDVFISFYLERIQNIRAIKAAASSSSNAAKPASE